MSGKTVDTVEEESEHTEKWAVPEEIGGELTPAPIVATARRAPDRHISRTVASPIPAMLAETMGLAQETETTARPHVGPVSKVIPTRR